MPNRDALIGWNGTSRIGAARRLLASLDFGSRGEHAYPTAIGAILIASMGMIAVRAQLGVLNVALIFLLVVFGIALLRGSGPASFAAILAFMIFNFLFIPPERTLRIASTGDLVVLFVFLGVAIVTGQLISRVQARTVIAVRERRRAEMLFELNAALIGDIHVDDILQRIVERVVTVYGAARSRILVPGEDGALRVGAWYPPTAPTELDRDAFAMAMWSMEHRIPAGLKSEGRHIRVPHGIDRPSTKMLRREADAIFLPVATKARVAGVLEVAGRPGGGKFSHEDQQLLATFADQAALATERAFLSAEAARADALAESDQLKTTLLSAVSHDLRTPLAAIKASATSLLDSSINWDAAARKEFLEAIDEETDRLTLMVGNLLDLTRIEGGVLRPDKAWYDVGELVEDVVSRLKPRLGSHSLTSFVEPSLPLVSFDYVEIAQVLTNLCENAIKYTPPGASIDIDVRQQANTMSFGVMDSGPGLTREEQAHIFEKFYRGRQAQRVPGSGLGLAICRGLVEAHGGRIWVESREGGGSVFRFTLPMSEGTQNGE